MTHKPAPAKSSGANQLLIDLGPVAVFVIAYNLLKRVESLGEDQPVYIATGLFIAATLAAIAYCKLKRGRIPPVLIVTGVLITGFGVLTILLQDRTFIQLKPTVLNSFYAVAILASLAIRQNVWKLLFGHTFTLPDRIWTILALRWAGFFAFLAVLNEYVRRSYSFDFWVDSRLWLVFPLVLVFAILNAPLVLKHAEPEQASPET